jgi:hypothetical protein
MAFCVCMFLMIARLPRCQEREQELIADCTEGNKEEGDAHPVEDPATSLGLELRTSELDAQTYCLHWSLTRTPDPNVTDWTS